MYAACSLVAVADNSWPGEQPCVAAYLGLYACLTAIFARQVGSLSSEIR